MRGNINNMENTVCNLTYEAKIKIRNNHALNNKEAQKGKSMKKLRFSGIDFLHTVVKNTSFYRGQLKIFGKSMKYNVLTIIIFTLFIIMGPIQGFGNGQKDLTGRSDFFQTTKSAATQEQLAFKVEVNYSTAGTIVNIKFIPQSNTSYTGFSASYVILRDSGKYVNPTGDGILASSDLNSAGNQVFESILPAPSTTFLLEAKNASNIYTSQIPLSEYWEGTGDFSGITNFNLFKKNSENIKIKINPNELNVEKEYYIVLIDSRSKYICLHLKLFAEFFKGERELFSSISGNYTYQYKALAFMNTFFAADDNSFKNAANKYCGIAKDNAVWNCFQTKLNTPDFPGYKEYFRQAFALHFASQQETIITNRYTKIVNLNIPYLNFNEHAFEEIYGTSTKNIYVYAYLFMAYEANKPIFSYPISEELHSNGINFNYTQYTKLSESAGNTLADNALKYLTGGVEYTPFNDNVTINTGNTTEQVFEKYNSLINNWISSGTTLKSRSNNYLPRGWESVNEEFSATPAPAKQIQVIRCGFDTNQLQITGELKAGQTMQASHLDIWTSHNLAWEAGLVERIITEGNDVYSQGVSTALNDKKIVLDSATSINNIKINRKSIKRENVIRVGYKFFTNQKIGALLLVRGYVPVPEKIDNTLTDLVEVQLYKDSDVSAPSLVIKGSELRDGLTEYVSYSKNNQVTYRRYKKGAADSSREAGFGIYNPLFSENEDKDETINKNKHVVYSYFIFPEPKEGYNKVVLVDKTGLTFLDVAELMVFPENPLLYADENKIDNNFLPTIDTVKTSNEMRSILSNRNFIVSKPFNTGLAQGKIYLNKTVLIDTVVLWEANAVPDSDSGVYVNEVKVLYGPFTGLNESAYYQPIWGGTNLAIHIKDKLKTPFNDLLSKKYGNPLPYAPKGIDSPRTFAYKMYEQVYVRDWYKKHRETDPLNWTKYMDYRFTDQGTTLAVDKQNQEDYFNCYVNEIDVNKRGRNQILGLDKANFTYTNYLSTPVKDVAKILKPFLPGNLGPNAAGYKARYDSPYSPDKTAGVDSVGLLSGAIGMGDSDPFDKIANIYNYSIGKFINQYYSFTTSALEHPQVDNKGNNISITGIDTNGFPIYYTNQDNSNSFLNTQEFRFTKADIEKATVLVPDIGQIQRGDILVKYEEAGDIHIGIVVGFTWETKPPIGSPASDYMDKVLVLSCRKGFRQVTLGTWGNPSSMFGGFTATPKLYQLRRLLTFTGNDIAAAGAAPSWEWVREANMKLRDYYPPRDQVPTDGRVWANSVAQYVTRVQSNDSRYRYYRYLPKTSLSYKTKISIFGTPIPSPSQTPAPQPTALPNMRITCLTGMRDLKQDGSIFMYHNGADVISSDPLALDTSIVYEIVNNGTPKKYGVSDGKEKSAVLVAPEDGLFYIFRSEQYLPDVNLPGNKIGIPDGFGGEEKLLLQSYSEQTYGLVGVLVTNPVFPRAGRVYFFHHLGPTIPTPDLQVRCPYLSYKVLYSPHYPDSLEHAILVKAGDFIGYMGNRGASSGSHVHLEVYEYFKETPNNKETKGWELVNPLSCFHESLYTFNENGIKQEDYNWWYDVWKNTTNFVTDINNHGINLINKPRIYLNDSISELVYADIIYHDNLLSGYTLTSLKNRILINEE